MNKTERKIALGVGVLFTTCICLYLVSTILIQLIVLVGILTVGAIGYVFIGRLNFSSDKDKEVLFKLMEVLSNPIAVKAKKIIHECTTNKHYKGDIDLDSVWDNPERFEALCEFKRQLSFYSKNFSKELIESGLWKEYVKYDHPLFYIECDSIPGVSQSIYNKTGIHALERR